MHDGGMCPAADHVRQRRVRLYEDWPEFDPFNALPIHRTGALTFHEVELRSAPIS